MTSIHLLIDMDNLSMRHYQANAFAAQLILPNRTTPLSR